MKYTYLLIDFFTILFPFLFSFHPRLNFYKTWPAFFPALIISAVIFLLGDSYFTYIGVWGFNPAYLTGFSIGNLPLEEVLFFVCVPYACVFTCYCLNLLVQKRVPKKTGDRLTVLLLFFFALTAVLNYSKLYTFYTFSVAALLLIMAAYIFKVAWLKEFYPAWLLILIPFFIVNGLLTGTGLKGPVVWYNNNQTLHFRLLTIPFEDIFYGLDLILLNILLYTYFLSRNKHLVDSKK